VLETAFSVVGMIRAGLNDDLAWPRMTVEDFLSLQVIPEPSVLVLLLGGVLIVRYARRRRS